MYRPWAHLKHNGGDVVIGLDAGEQTAFVATLPSFAEAYRRRVPVEAGREYHLRACIRPPRVELYVDDLLAVQCAFAPREFRTPSIGVFVDRGEVLLRDLAAYRLG